ncbi:MAG TPA: zinc-ribbon domain-containing protein [Syntrophomonadaceae bacterium]|nr:zinc-ribbon domain-containing protein [Syntrophomonadaceae bacterium]
MYCSKCGSEIIENQRFCNKCGYSIAGEGTPELTAESGLPLTVATKAKRINPILIVALVIGGLLLVLLFLKGCFGVTLGTSNTPEGVTKAFMETIVRGDQQAATNFCYNKNEAYSIVGHAVLHLCDLSSDYKIRHKPVSYKTTKQTDNKAKIVVYDEKSHAICGVELTNIKGKWYITACP